MRIRYRKELGWYQLDPPNLKLCSNFHNLAQMDCFVARSVDLLEYSIFIHQTARRMIGDTKANAILAVLEELLTTGYQSRDIHTTNCTNSSQSA